MSHKVEFEPSKTWRFNETIDESTALLFTTSWKSTTLFSRGFITPLHGGFYGYGNRYVSMSIWAEEGYGCTLDYVLPYGTTTEDDLNRRVYRSGTWVGGDAIRTIQLDNAPTGTFLSFLQQTATPIS